MVHEEIQKRLLDGQLDESDLTLNDLRAIEDSFVRTLTTMYHGRIKYPGPDAKPERSERGSRSRGDDSSDGSGEANGGAENSGGGRERRERENGAPVTEPAATSEPAVASSRAVSERPDVGGSREAAIVPVRGARV